MRSQSACQAKAPKPSLTAVTAACAKLREPTEREASKSPSYVLPMRPGYPSSGLPEGVSLASQRLPVGRFAEPKSTRLETSNGSSLQRLSKRSVYEAWCRTHDHTPLSAPKFAAALKALGYAKWKSCGVICYRGTAVRRVTKPRRARPSNNIVRTLSMKDQYCVKGPAKDPRAKSDQVVGCGGSQPS